MKAKDDVIRYKVRRVNGTQQASVWLPLPSRREKMMIRTLIVAGLIHQRDGEDKKRGKQEQGKAKRWIVQAEMPHHGPNDTCRG